MTVSEAQNLIEVALRLNMRQDNISLLIAGRYFERIRQWYNNIPTAQITLDEQKIAVKLPFGYKQIPVIKPGPQVS